MAMLRRVRVAIVLQLYIEEGEHIMSDIKVKPICMQCGSDSIEFRYRGVDEWHIDTQEWLRTCDDDGEFWCDDCGEYIADPEYVPPEFDKDEIKELPSEVLSAVYDLETMTWRNRMIGEVEAE
jgi:hypothetical protein